MKLTQSELGRIFRSLASLLHAGISPGEGLFLLAQEETAHAPLLTRLAEALDQGSTLSEAMTESGAFPRRCAAMTAVGEETGRLEEALLYLAEACDESCRTARLLKQSLGYPAALFVLMLGVIVLLLTQVLPVFDRVYASLGTELTGIAAGLLALGRGLKAAGPVLAWLAGIGLIPVLVCRFCGTARNYVNQKFREAWSDRGILRHFANARFARALAMGIGSGLTAEEAVALAARLLEENPGAASRCRRALEDLRQGEDLALALQKARLLPAARGRMLAVGLRSGNVDPILTDVADRMEADARQALEDLLARLEPAMVLLGAAMVGLILLSVMLPLLDVLSALG